MFDQIDIQLEGSCLFVKVEGNRSVNNVLDLMGALMDECLRRQCSKVLVDFREAVGDVSTADRFEQGEFLATMPGIAKFKIAAVDRPECVTLFMRLVARNRGVNFDVFTDMDAAEKWLHGEC